MIDRLEQLQAEVDQALDLLRRLAAAGLLGEAPNAKPAAASTDAIGVSAPTARQSQQEALGEASLAASTPAAASGAPEIAPRDGNGAEVPMSTCEADGCDAIFPANHHGGKRRFCGVACRQRTSVRRKVERHRQAAAEPVEQPVEQHVESAPAPIARHLREPERPLRGVAMPDDPHSDPSRLAVPKLPWETNAEAYP